ncbi:MAG: carbonic anhydrase [Phoenicibacter congonensis]|uniref:carbonic anhydrase n=1 Tax=Phoenicibacter congonensis TaxID=1944646 RepID=A0AA43UB97_9ACTN|nr:carbonic anhydrase [Phoenicibacter congonensis]
MNATEALSRLKEGNERFVTARSNDGDISSELREKTTKFGQQPYAVVISCSDSRVVPEHIFMTGIAELFVIRVAGNIVTDTQLASVVYAADHLKSPLVVVMGHTHCGAIDSTIKHAGHGCLCALTDPIAEAIGEETDDRTACKLNVEAGVSALKANAAVKGLIDAGVEVVGAIYDIETGKVEFL